ncbi:MAG: ribonuclease HII [Victivallaceae bacterium]|nr:ribonuclease HII [Victivallaceae bacterium]
MAAEKPIDELLGLERQLRAEGFLFIGGVDEAGRGPLAGPVVAACVVFPDFNGLPHVNDSKQLSAARREELETEIKEFPGVRWALGIVDAAEIDRINILQATYKAMREAIAGVSQVEVVLVDGNPVPGLPVKSRSVVKGDACSASIAAASILAKVCRDRMMTEFDRRYPEYGFAGHKGYGTAAHLLALEKYGACEIHRRSFAPVKRIVEGAPEQLDFWKN